MGHLTTAPARVIAALEAAGIRTTTDPRNVNPPTVWVEYVTGDRLSRCSVAVDLDVTVVVPGPPNGDALAALDKLADQTAAALDAAGIPWTTARLGTTPSPATGEALPALTLTTTLTTEV